LSILLLKTKTLPYSLSDMREIIRRWKNTSPSGQAAVEYLLTLSVVFAGLAGVSALFWGKIERYLSVLIAMIQLPF
jgi:hypothetical protein